MPPPPQPEQALMRMVEKLAVGIEVMEVQLEALDWGRDILKYLESNELPKD